MTREEATEIIDKLPLCNECDSSNFPYSCVECGDAFLLAIKALKEPEIVRCKECRFGEACKNGRGEHGVMCYNSHSASHSWVHEPDWFCADGRRFQDE